MLVRRIKNRIYQFLKRRFLSFSHIDPSVSIGKDSRVWQSELYGKIQIGERCLLYQTKFSGNVFIGNNTSLWGPNIQVLSRVNPIHIGSFCSIARDVTIQEYFHNPEQLTTYFIGKNVFGEPFQKEILSKGPIEIGSDVWIGTGVQIMSGVKIGHGAIIGANAVVTKEVPPYSIFAGNPAKLIKYRFSKARISELLDLKWWEWEINQILENKYLFK